MKARLYAFMSVAIMVTYESLAGMIFIDANYNNGSFESGVISPWDDGTVVSNADFAADGTCYAQTIPDLSRAEIYQFLPGGPADGWYFVLGFRVRNGSPGYPVISASLSAQRQNGSFINAAVLQSNTPPVTAGEWSGFSYIFAFDEGLGDSLSTKVSIWFDDGETNSAAFVDSVSLVALPAKTRIKALAVNDGTLTLSIDHLAPTNTCWIQRSFTLADGDWVSVSEVDLIKSVVQWSEDASNQWDKAFYRIWKE